VRIRGQVWLGNGAIGGDKSYDYFCIRLDAVTPMSQQLTLELSDAVYANLQHQANTLGLSATEWIVSILSRPEHGALQVANSTEAQEQSWQRFRSHAGAISLGYATDMDNEAIDADLAKAYAEQD
jgi:hypothetical protein